MEGGGEAGTSGLFQLAEPSTALPLTPASLARGGRFPPRGRTLSRIWIFCVFHLDFLTDGDEADIFWAEVNVK